MAERVLTLGQSYPDAGSLTALYTVGTGISAVVSTFTACNQAKTATTFRMSVALAGVSDTSKQYVYYDVPLGPNDTFAATIGMALSEGDIVRVYSGNGRVSFNVFGVQRS